MTKTIFEQIGGEDGCYALAQAFYDKMLNDPLMRPLFDDPSQDHTGRMAWWLTEIFGGPARHTEHRGGFGSVVRAHAGRKISEQQLALWLEYMLASCDELDFPNEVMDVFKPYLERSARAAMIHSNFT